MTAEEAIAIYKSPEVQHIHEWSKGLKKASQLGLEALEWLSERRKTSPALANIFLPSETIPCRK